MNVERFIAVYDKDDDSLIEDIKIGLSTALLHEVMDIDKSDDPDAYKPYTLTELQFGKLKALLPELGEFDFGSVRMHLESFSIE